MTLQLEFFKLNMLSAKYISSQIFYQLGDKIHYHGVAEVADSLKPLKILPNTDGYFGTIHDINTYEQLYDLTFKNEDFIIDTVNKSTVGKGVHTRSLVDLAAQKIVRIYDTKLTMGNSDYFFQYNCKLLGLLVEWNGIQEYLYFPIIIKSNHIFSYIDGNLIYEFKSLLK